MLCTVFSFIPNRWWPSMGYNLFPTGFKTV